MPMIFPIPFPPLPQPVPGLTIPAMGFQVPVGVVVAFAGALTSSQSGTSSTQQSPDLAILLESQGWLVCDGRSIKIAQYPELYLVIGKVYGKGNQDDEFCLPDYRGYFFRGVDGGTGNDPDASNRKPQPSGVMAPDKVGSIQEDALQKHDHMYQKNTAPLPVQGGAAEAPLIATQPVLTENGPTNSLSPPGTVKVSDSETRPKNVYVNYLIKSTTAPNPNFSAILGVIPLMNDDL